jgi:hypothetical protein
VRLRALRLGLAAACLATGVAVQAADAAPASAGTWTFSATHNADGWIRITQPIVIHGWDLANEIALREKPSDAMVAIKGWYGGVVLRDMHGDVAYAVFRYRSSLLLSEWGDRFDENMYAHLPAGRYRVTVMGNGATTVHLPVRGAPARSVHVSGPAAVRAYEARDDGLLPAGSYSLPLSIKKSSTYLVLNDLTGSEHVPARTDPADMCISPPGGKACLSASAGMTSALSGVGQNAEEATVIFGYPNGFPLPAGAYEGRLARVTAGETSHRAFVTLAVD